MALLLRAVDSRGLISLIEPIKYYGLWQAGATNRYSKVIVKLKVLLAKKLPSNFNII